MHIGAHNNIIMCIGHTTYSHSYNTHAHTRMHTHAHTHAYMHAHTQMMDEVNLGLFREQRGLPVMCSEPAHLFEELKLGPCCLRKVSGNPCCCPASMELESFFSKLVIFYLVLYHSLL